MTEKRKSKEKSKRAVGVEQPRIGEKVQPIGVQGARSDRHEFGSLTRKLVDEMGKLGTPITESQARKAVERGWANKEERDHLNSIVDRWSRVVGIKIRTSFDDTQGGGTREGEINFTRVFAEDVRMAPDIIVGHEAGHSIEHCRMAWSVEEFRRREDYLGDYVRLGFKHRKFSLPPFSLTRHHQRQEGRFFDTTYETQDSDGRAIKRSLREDVGYNARQIYCDSIPFKEVLHNEKARAWLEKTRIEAEVTGGGKHVLYEFRYEKHKDWFEPILSTEENPLTVYDLIGQYMKYLEIQYKVIAAGSGDLTGTLHVSFIPLIARFAASAWAMEFLCSCIKDPEKKLERTKQLRDFSNRFLKLFGSKDLSRGEILDLRETPSGQQTEELERLEAEYEGASGKQPAPYGLGVEAVHAIMVLVRAYKRHFLTCIEDKDLITLEDLRPHIERLKYGSEAERITTDDVFMWSVNKKILEGLPLEDDARKARYGLIDLIAEKPAKRVMEAVLPAFGNTVLANPNEPDVLNLLPRVTEFFEDGDRTLREFMFLVWGKVIEKNKGNPALLNCMPKISAYLKRPEPEVKEVGLRAWLEYAKHLQTDQQVWSQLPAVCGCLGDETPRVRETALHVWKQAWDSSNNPTLLGYKPKALSLSEDPDDGVRELAISIWSDLYKENPRDEDLNSKTTQVFKHLKDPSPIVKRAVISAYYQAFKVNAEDERVAAYLPALAETFDDEDHFVNYDSTDCWKRIVWGGLDKKLVFDNFHKLEDCLRSPSGWNRMHAAEAWKSTMKKHPDKELMLRAMSDLGELMNEKEIMYARAGLKAFGFATLQNPTEEAVLTQMPVLRRFFNDTWYAKPVISLIEKVCEANPGSLILADMYSVAQKAKEHERYRQHKMEDPFKDFV